ncbi:MAG: 30S ribosomal protein S17 [DPANN group archaeon]|nr:30S ribosomal protein S17 [DPANN group archaeon]
MPNTTATEVSSDLPKRGAVLSGRVVSNKPKNTLVVESEYLHYITKYKRYERRKSRRNVHIPPGYNANPNDVVEFAETRKISKTKSFVVTKIIPKQ